MARIKIMDTSVGLIWIKEFLQQVEIAKKLETGGAQTC